MSEAEKNACADIHKCLDVAKASVRGAAAAELAAEEQEGRTSNQTQHRPPSPPPPPSAAAAVTSVLSTPQSLPRRLLHNQLPSKSPSRSRC